MKLKIDTPMASAPMLAAESPAEWPAMAVPTMPIRGTVMFETMLGSARRRISRFIDMDSRLRVLDAAEGCCGSGFRRSEYKDTLKFGKLMVPHGFCFRFRHDACAESRKLNYLCRNFVEAWALAG